MIPMRNNKMNTIMFQTSNSIVFVLKKLTFSSTKQKYYFLMGKTNVDVPN